ncbi:MAG: hypothetical protein ACI8WB_004570, partial [Phenylobacterium sp.]
CQLPEHHITKHTESEYLSRWAGYLYHAAYHYTVSLHYVRQYNLYKIRVSAVKFNLIFDEVTFSAQLPYFQSMSLSSTLADLAEVTLPRVYYPSLMADVAGWEGSITGLDCNTDAEKRLSTKSLDDDLRHFVDLTRNWVITETIIFNQEHCKGKASRNFINRWFGTINERDGKGGKLINIGNYGEIENNKPSSSLEGLLGYLAFNHLSAVYLNDAGYCEDAAYELMRGVESINHMLDKIYFDEIEAFEGMNILITFLIQRALYRLERAYGYFKNDRGNSKNQEEQKREFTDYIPPKLVVALLTLKINTCRFKQSYRGVFKESYLTTDDQSVKKESTLRPLVVDLTKLVDSEIDFDHLFYVIDNEKTLGRDDIRFQKAVIVQRAQDILEKYLRICRFPILNRLNGLNTMVGAALYLNDTKRAIALANELLELNEKYDSPFHFMPINIAIMAYRIANQLENPEEEQKLEAQKKNEINRKYWDCTALEFTTKSQQMYTQRAGYYESISGLYYLYDDFNDRHIHHGHALQMFWASSSKVMENEIKTRLKES